MCTHALAQLGRWRAALVESTAPHRVQPLDHSRGPVRGFAPGTAGRPTSVRPGGRSDRGAQMLLDPAVLEGTSGARRENKRANVASRDTARRSGWGVRRLPPRVARLSARHSRDFVVAARATGG